MKASKLQRPKLMSFLEGLIDPLTDFDCAHDKQDGGCYMGTHRVWRWFWSDH